ncbi:MAG: hypothetical protein DUD27_02820 [Lachnospiraceae bacterium]|uniref:Uncharacterized protein n=1 Tax=Candidatus Weimeria bifida TaxID=2599074 RepID=A0A6N7J290_9FIRM|nr:hypothetical protein [Candidatus Weimeria bifida]RRF96849.1 MAG: hypothetical protein DUD27_02820 [Lachnospiraceae bacterium]
MKKIRLLIADTDKAYLSALVTYMIGAGGHYEVSGFTEENDFLSESNDYSLALLGDEFIDIVEKNPEKKRQFGNILHLKGDVQGDERGYEVIYKFQKMSLFIEQIQRAFQIKTSEQASFSGKKGQRIQIIYSPMHHELALPFSLSMAKVIGESSQTLFVDMEGVSVFSKLLERNIRRDLGDYLYHIMGKTDDGKNITDFLGFYENFYYLAPMKGLTALACVTVEQWMALMENLSRTDFEQIIILMDQMVQGGDALLQSADDILLLGKPGSYYDKSMRAFTAELEKEGLTKKCHQLLLPMSVSQQPGDYHIRTMLNGNLGGFVRKEFMNAAAF